MCLRERISLLFLGALLSSTACGVETSLNHAQVAPLDGGVALVEPMDATAPEPEPPPADASVPLKKDAGVESGARLDAGAAPDASEPPPIVLVRALELNIHETVDFPLVDERDTTMTILGRVTITIAQSGATTFHQEFCQIGMDAGTDRLQVAFPLTALRGFADLLIETTLPPLDVGLAVDLPPVTQLVGWTSANPETDPLPEKDDDRRVIDGDLDGKPGITTLMSEPINAQVYVASRTRLALHGRLISLDRIEGYAEGVVEMALLGGSRGVVPDRALRTTPAPDQTQNRFVLVSIPGPDSCADIRANAATLFR